MSHRFKVGQRVRFKASHSSFEIVRLLPALPNGTNQYRIKSSGAVSGLCWRTTSRPLPWRRAGKIILRQAGRRGRQFIRGQLRCPDARLSPSQSTRCSLAWASLRPVPKTCPAASGYPSRSGLLQFAIHPPHTIQLDGRRME